MRNRQAGQGGFDIDRDIEYAKRRHDRRGDALHAQQIRPRAFDGQILVDQQFGARQVDRTQDICGERDGAACAGIGDDAAQ